MYIYNNKYHIIVYLFLMVNLVGLITVSGQFVTLNISSAVPEPGCAAGGIRVKSAKHAAAPGAPT